MADFLISLHCMHGNKLEAFGQALRRDARPAVLLRNPKTA
jgi:hypothetical protein